MTIQIACHWRLTAQRYGLIGSVCSDCNRKIFPPREVCPHCAEKTETLFSCSSQQDTHLSTTFSGNFETAPIAVTMELVKTNSP
jgi:uncharacterized OB-fold protein